MNWCGHADRANGVAFYLGSTSRRLAHDGTNTVDWGSLKRTQNCTRALACTMTWYDADGTPVESDVRFNVDTAWSVRAGDTRHDIQSIAAHEFGHARQFGHVHSTRPGQNSVVMWPYFMRGDMSPRKLGRGDSLANNAHY